MIFYLANNQTLCPTQAEAKVIDRDFVQIDIPTDKPKLQAYVQDLMNKINDLCLTIDSQIKQPTPSEVEVLAEMGIVDERAAGLPPILLPPSIVQDLDDVWDDLPLARKAHFAAMFCEEARLKIK